MRVLHVINSLSGSGGAEHGLVREITRFGQGMEQLVIRLYPQDRLASHLDEAGISQRGLGLDSSQSAWNWLPGVARLRQTIRDFQPDVVHSTLFSANLVAQLATRGYGIPVLSTFTLSGDPALMRAHQPGADTWRAALLRRVGAAVARADHVWFRALSRDALLTNCAALGVSPERGVVIPRGVPIPEGSQRAATREELGLPSDLPIVLNVGRQTAQKGHAHLVRAFALVLRDRPTHLVILGREGDGTALLRDEISARKLGEHVTVIDYTGSISDYYRQADVFAFSSLMEGLGTAVLEAMAARVPVVAFDIPPIREATDGGRMATLVPVGDDENLGVALLEALDNQIATRRQTEAALEWVRAEFSLDQIASRVRERLQQLAEGKDRASMSR